MKGTDNNLATSILFVGYLLMQLPSNLFLTRVRPSLFLGIAMAIWYASILKSIKLYNPHHFAGVSSPLAKRPRSHSQDWLSRASSSDLSKRHSFLELSWSCA
jgi:hypothetical protein